MNRPDLVESTAEAAVAARILVVDDDETTRELLAEYLSEYDYRVTGVADGQAMHKALRDSVVDLIVLDLRLHGEDGLTLARTLRAESSIPIIMLTGRKTDVDRIMGLELGADDYVTKPFNPRELVARIRTVLRRAQQGKQVTGGPADKVRAYRFAGWELDLRTHRLTSPGAQQVTLTHAEYGLLVALLGAPQRILSRDQLLEMTRGYDEEVFDRSIDVQILRLRRKLERDPARPEVIRTERGVGYYLNVPVQAV
jgi:two-component system, OmpR family, response regulator